MGLFFKSKPDATVSAIQIALGKASISDQNLLQKATKEIMEETKATSSKEVKGVNVFIGIVILAGSLLGALFIDNEKASQTFLDCFKILFTAFIGFFGYEANKEGTS